MLLIFLGAVGKSGQMPLHVWLPDAMAGPTPVSALIHAATMVTAGIFLLARLYPVIAQSLTVMNTMADRRHDHAVPGRASSPSCRTTSRRSWRTRPSPSSAT